MNMFFVRVAYVRSHRTFFIHQRWNSSSCEQPDDVILFETIHPYKTWLHVTAKQRVVFQFCMAIYQTRAAPTCSNFSSSRKSRDDGFVNRNIITDRFKDAWTLINNGVRKRPTMRGGGRRGGAVLEKIEFYSRTNYIRGRNEDVCNLAFFQGRKLPFRSSVQISIYFKLQRLFFTSAFW